MNENKLLTGSSPKSAQAGPIAQVLIHSNLKSILRKSEVLIQNVAWSIRLALE